MIRNPLSNWGGRVAGKDFVDTQLKSGWGASTKSKTGVRSDLAFSTKSKPPTPSFEKPLQDHKNGLDALRTANLKPPSLEILRLRVMTNILRKTLY